MSSPARSSFEEVIFLLWNLRLPNHQELAALSSSLRQQRELPGQVVDLLTHAPGNANPMDVLRTAVSMLGLYDGSCGRHSRGQLSARPVLDGESRRDRGLLPSGAPGQEPAPVRQDLGEAAHFLYLLDDAEPTKQAAETLDLAYVLHADHGMNASTFTARVVIATLTDVLFRRHRRHRRVEGALARGANEGVIHMLREIGSEDRVDAWVEEQLAQKKKIMGIGHRVYRTLDPRAPHLRAMAVKLTEQLGEGKWIRMCERIAALMKEKKGLNANVDFYSATVYYSLGLPTDLFTPIFAIARTAGWTAHILEQLEDNRLYRPLSEYTGTPVGLTVLPIDQR